MIKNLNKTILILLIILFANVLGLFLLESGKFYRIIENLIEDDGSSDFDYYHKILINLEITFYLLILFSLICLVFYKKLSNVFYRILNVRKLYLHLIIITSIIQLILIISFPNKPFADSIQYINLAQNLIKSGSYINQNGLPTAFMPVGYPIYLFLIFKFISQDLIVVKIFNILISALFILILYQIFKTILTIKQLNLFLLLFAFYPNFLLNANVFMPDYLASFFMWFTIYLLLYDSSKYYKILLSGLFIGFGVLLRPQYSLVPFILLILLHKKEHLKKFLIRVLLFFAAISIMIMPWLIRNYKVFNEFPVLTTNDGFNFLMGNHSISSGKVNFNFIYDVNNPDETEEQNLAYKRAWQDITENPEKSILRIFKKIFFSYYRGDSNLTWIFKSNSFSYNPLSLASLFIVSNLYHYIVIFFFLTGFKKLIIFLKRKGLLFFVYLTIYFLIVVSIYVGNERYILPILPIHFLAAALYFSNYEK